MRRNRKSRERSFRFVFFSSFVLLFAVAVFSLLIGSVPIGGVEHLISIVKGAMSFLWRKEIQGNDDPLFYILFSIRLPRILAAGLVGAALSICGAVTQGILKNPMADPYTLGISSGAALGAAVSTIFDERIPLRMMAFLVALAVVLFTAAVSTRCNSLRGHTLILLGLNVNYLLSAVTSLLLFLHRDKVERIFFWTMGSYSAVQPKSVWIMAAVSLPLMVFLCWMGRYVHAMAFGEEVAKSLGIPVELFRRAMLVVVSLLTAFCVSATGVIGFVGLMVPHMADSLFSSNDQYRLPLSAVLGAIVMIIADDLARILLAPSEIPIGIVTSFLGAPFFLFLLLKERGT